MRGSGAFPCRLNEEQAIRSRFKVIASLISVANHRCQRVRNELSILAPVSSAVAAEVIGEHRCSVPWWLQQWLKNWLRCLGSIENIQTVSTGARRFSKGSFD